MTPVKLAPSCEANLILCASPPDKVGAVLSKLKYPKLTLDKNSSLDKISSLIFFHINSDVPLKDMDKKNFLHSSTVKLHISEIL